jgi:hypothetical protein
LFAFSVFPGDDIGDVGDVGEVGGKSEDNVRAKVQYWQTFFCAAAQLLYVSC